MEGVQPAVLRWARETAGLSPDDAAKALALNAAKGLNPAQRVLALESGAAAPTRPLLEKMAKAYRRPLLAFYLAEPPKKGDRGSDFRTLPDRERDNAQLDALVRDIKVRQGIIRSILEDTEAEPLPFIGSANADESADDLARTISRHVHFSLDEFRARKDPNEAFAYLRDCIEEAGVFLLLLGNLGSYHTNISIEVFRGFALADHLAPLIVINDSDARAAWSFTAFHELVHLWLGVTGVSGTNESQNTIERFCNDVASEILLPEAELAQLTELRNTDSAKADATISTFARQRNISRSMIAYKLFRKRIIDHDLWNSLTKRFDDQWREQKRQESEKNKELEGGPNYYVVRRHRIGQALLGLVRRSLDDGTITYTKAGLVLGVKPGSVAPLLKAGEKR